jgi:hypothetical protein
MPGTSFRQIHLFYTITEEFTDYSSHNFMLCFFFVRSGESRPLSLELWKRMNTEVAKLHSALGQIDLAWTEDDRSDQTARPAINAASITLSSGTGT